MNMDNLMENMFRTLSTLNLCLNNTDGIVYYDIDNAIKCLKSMLLKKEYEVIFNDKCEKIDKEAVYKNLSLVGDNILYYSDYFKDDNILGAWWNVTLALSDLELEELESRKYSPKELIRK